MIKFLLIVPAIYLLGIIIKYVIDLQDLEKFSAICASMNNLQTSDPKAEKINAKWAYAFVAFVGALLWPVLLVHKFRRTEKAD